MTRVERFLAPNESNWAFIVPLGHGSGTGGRWRLYLGLSRNYLSFILLLTATLDSLLLFGVVNILRTIPPRIHAPVTMETVLYASLLLIGCVIVGRILLDGIRLAYFLKTGKYIISDEHGESLIQSKQKR
mgnify:FL=1